MGHIQHQNTAASCQPVDITLSKSSGVLTINWANGEISSISDKRLRQHCACSGCRSQRTSKITLVSEDIAVSKLELMGSTGLNIAFDDGHDKGVYPWAYLRAIAEGTAESFIET